MRLFYRTKDYEALLRSTASEDPRAQAILDSGRLLRNVQAARVSGGQKPESVLKTIMEGMADFLKEYPAQPSYKQGLWETCKGWADRIAARLEVAEYDFSEQAPRPVVRDTGIALVKALHPSGGKTKEELGRELAVGPKTIQTGLRALDPRLTEGGMPPAPFRIAGQEMHVRIDCRKDEITGKRWYHTANRLHPIALQLNTMQAGNLLRALQEIDAGPDQAADNEVCRGIALDVWIQLSPTARARLKKIYRGRYPEFASFLDELEDAAEEGLLEFRTEREMERELELEIRQQLELAAKGGRRCSLTLRQEDREMRLEHVVIDWDTGDGAYLAIPADPLPDREKAVRFRLDEVEEYLAFDR